MNENNNNADTKKSPLEDLGVVGLAGMEIKVLGPGCPKCKTLEKATLEAVAETGVKATVTKVDDIVEIMNYGVMTTPALVINNKVVVKGRVPSKDEIKKLITN
ncbi:MAG TPA: thioredoxin family protein [Prolixibacteraceae bacterium]|nr:thioredoxin family protein [Prolixibacteraceae bacterium]